MLVAPLFNGLIDDIWCDYFVRGVIFECVLEYTHFISAEASINLLKSPSLALFMVCRKSSVNCPPEAPPTAPSIGCAGCSGNWASPTAPSNLTGYCCCPGNAHPPITSSFWRCCCSGGGSKPAVPSVEKLEKLKNFSEKSTLDSSAFCSCCSSDTKMMGRAQSWQLYLCQDRCSVPLDTPGEYPGWRWILLANILIRIFKFHIHDWLNIMSTFLSVCQENRWREIHLKT